MKIAICNELFENWSVERVFDYAARLGYDGVELAPFTLGETVFEISAAHRDKISRAAADAGVEIVGLHWLLARPGGMYINHPDGGIRRKTQDYLKQLIGLCADLGGGVLVHGSPKQRSLQEGWDLGETWKLARETFEVCAREAEKHGVQYCLEALTPVETNFINTIAEAHEMVNQVGSPNFQLMFDCRSISDTAGDDLPGALQAALDSKMIKHVHINDANGRGPGFGDLQFAPLLKILKDHLYRDYISVEVFDFKPDPETIASRSLGYLHGICESLGVSTRGVGLDGD